MRTALLLVLCLPALAAAQTQLGKAEVAARQRQGYVFYEGRHRLPQEIAYLQAAAARRGLAPTPTAQPVAKAPAVEARRGRAQHGSLRLPMRGRSTGLLSVRLQHVQLLGMDTVPVSLGTGQARLQLPRTQSISIGTTVGLPLR